MATINGSITLIALPDIFRGIGVNPLLPGNPAAGDDLAAKSAVLELANQLGFDGLDAGLLAESWRQQPGTPIYTTDLPPDAAQQALADATPEQTASWSI